MAKRVLAIIGSVLLVGGLTIPVAAQEVRMTCGGLEATIVGTIGDDHLIGTDGPDVIHGMQGDDLIEGLDGADVLCGGKGHDIIAGGLDFDIIYGAQGDDLIYASADLGGFPPEALEDVRGARIFAGAGNDTVYGSNRWDRMQGGPGNDVLYGFAGNDWMRGGPGSDEVYGHAGSDDLHGGMGSDWVAADARDSAVRAGAGNDFCPNIASRVRWQGCNNRLPTNPVDPTLPATGLPTALVGGEEDTYVYLGYVGSIPAYVGITKDLESAGSDVRFTGGILELNVTPLTRGQARAIEQAVLQENPQFFNEINSISPAQPYFANAVAWGEDWLDLNGW